MLKEYKSMTQEEMYTLVHEIYIEGCMENAREKYSDATDLTTAIQQEEDSFVCFLQDFFTLPENTYYVLEKNNMPVSAARLSKINDFYHDPSYADMLFNYITVIPYSNSITSEASV